MNSVAYLPQSKRLLDQVREVLRYEHYSLKTEQAFLYWIRFFRALARATGKCKMQRPTRPRRIPSVLTKTEVAALLGALDGEMALLAKLLCTLCSGHDKPVAAPSFA